MAATAQIIQFPRFNAPKLPERCRLRGGHVGDKREAAIEALGEYALAKAKELAAGTGVDLSHFEEVVGFAFTKLQQAMPTSWRDPASRVIAAKGTESYEALVKEHSVWEAIRVVEATQALTLDDLRRVPDEKLQRVDGIGKTKFARIRAALGALGEPAEA